MEEKPQTVSLTYYGISPWEIEVIYEVENMLKKYEIEYRVWNNRIKKYVHTVFDNYKIKLVTPNLPVFAWKPMLFVIGTIGSMYLWKYLDTIF